MRRVVGHDVWKVVCDGPYWNCCNGWGQWVDAATHIEVANSIVDDLQVLTSSAYRSSERGVTDGN